MRLSTPTIAQVVPPIIILAITIKLRSVYNALKTHKDGQKGKRPRTLSTVPMVKQAIERGGVDAQLLERLLKIR